MSPCAPRCSGPTPTRATCGWSCWWPRSLVDATTETGEITLAVPADTTYRVDAGSDSGDERVLVPLDPASTRTLHASSDTGDVTVRPTR